MDKTNTQACKYNKYCDLHFYGKKCKYSVSDEIFKEKHQQLMWMTIDPRLCLFVLLVWLFIHSHQSISVPIDTYLFKERKNWFLFGNWCSFQDFCLNVNFNSMLSVRAILFLYNKKNLIKVLQIDLYQLPIFLKFHPDCNDMFRSSFNVINYIQFS